MTRALACLLAWSAGIALGTVALPVAPAVAAGAIAGAALSGCVAIAVRPAAVGLALAALLLGVARAEAPAADPTAAARAPALAGTVALVEGRVADDPRFLASGEELLVAPDRLGTATGDRQPAGSVIVFVRGTPAIGIDDHVQATGRLSLPRNLPGFDRRAYAAQRGAYLEMRGANVNVVRRAAGLRSLPGWLRDRYREAIVALVPPPHAGVLVGVVLGIRSGIPPRLQQDLIATGLVHLLVLSGLKVAVFARLVTGVLGPALGRAATWPALALIALYALAGGATPAALRASAMGGVALVAQRLGRPTHVWTSLAATAAAMLAWRPELAWDVGFQLSFAGTVAIIVLTPPVEHRLGWVPAWLREPLAVTFAAQVGTVPLMANDFHVLSPVAPLANAAVLPLLPAMVAVGLLVAPLASLPDLGRLAALPLVGLLTYLEQVTGLLARVPAAAVPIPSFPPWTGAAYYAALGGGVAAANTRGTVRRAAIVAGVVAPLLVGAAELAAWARPQPSAAVLAVGQGQAVLLTGPGGYVLVDGGASPARLADELGAHVPPWRRRLEGLVITGPGIGHVGGLAGLAYPAGVVVLPAGDPGGSAMRTAALTQQARGAQLLHVSAGQRFALAGLDFEVLSPAARPPQPDQLAFRVSGSDGRTFCDVADLDPDGQTAAAARLRGGCDALLLPSGGRSAPVPDLMAAARPGLLIASDSGSGQLARGLPAGILSRTSQDGTIVQAL
jgi:competence protein ComEC